MATPEQHADGLVERSDQGELASRSSPAYRQELTNAKVPRAVPAVKVDGTI
jgi:hypothetical protein